MHPLFGPHVLSCYADGSMIEKWRSDSFCKALLRETGAHFFVMFEPML